MDSFQPREEPVERGRGFETTRIFAVSPDDRHKVCSVYPEPISIDAYGLHLIIPGLKPGEKYTYAWVPTVPDVRDSGEGRRQVTFLYPAKRVAQQNFGDASYKCRGIFVPEGEDPTTEEIAAAERERNSWWEQKVIPDGDRDYAKRQDPGDVDGNAKLAIQWLGLKRAWGPIIETGGYCPACREAVKVDARKCKECGALINWVDGVPIWANDPDLPKYKPGTGPGIPKIGRPPETA